MGSLSTQVHRVQVQDLPLVRPPSQKNKGGVSVENMPDANKQWFVLRVTYGRIIKAKAFVEAKGL